MRNPIVSPLHRIGIVLHSDTYVWLSPKPNILHKQNTPQKRHTLTTLYINPLKQFKLPTPSA